MDKVFDPDQSYERIQVYTSFKGVLARQNHALKCPDQLILEPSKSALGWMIDKEEKDRIRRVLRAAVKADQRTWESEHPGQEYPVKFATHAPRRTAKEADQVMLSIGLPETADGRRRFFDIFVRTLGLQIFIENYENYPVAQLAREVERAHYARLAAPVLEDREKFKAIRERRSQHRSMMDSAFSRKALGVEDRPAVDAPSLLLAPIENDHIASAGEAPLIVESNAVMMATSAEPLALREDLIPEVTSSPQPR